MVGRAVKEITLTGYTRSNSSITVSSEVSGKVIRVNYDVGQAIEKKPFYEIDPTFIGFEISTTKQSIKKLDTTLKQMSSRVDYLKKEFKRMDKLHRGDRATEVKRDAAKEEYDQARFEFETVKLEKAMLKIKQKELQERKNRHKVFAPEGWIVTQKIVENNEIINFNTPLAKVADYRNLVIPLAVSAEEYESIKRLAESFEASLENKKITSKINWVNPEFDEKSRKLNIELGLTGYEGPRRGGLRFSLPIKIPSEGMLVPKAAIINRYENPRVKIKNTGKIVPVLILGQTNGNVTIADNRQLEIGEELFPAEIKASAAE